MPDQDWVLRSLRGTRASPPALAAGDEDRRALYGAALEQFEQLLCAAGAVGPAARPLPLFYALSQAGRAIVAASGDEPHVESHGLTEVRRNPPPADLLHRQIKRAASKNGRDAFGAVSRAIGSPELQAPVELGALWAALPRTYRLPKSSWLPEWRGALDVLDETAYRAEKGESRVQVLSLGGNPHHGEIDTLRDRYLSLPPDTKVSLKPGSEQLGPGNWIAVLTWSVEHDLDAIAPKDAGAGGANHLMPTLPGHDERLSGLMTWWLLLFGLSIFARYHPQLWVRALDVDSSQHAVPLEGLLDQALLVVPALVHDALLGH